MVHRRWKAALQAGVAAVGVASLLWFSARLDTSAPTVLLGVGLAVLAVLERRRHVTTTRLVKQLQTGMVDQSRGHLITIDEAVRELGPSIEGTWERLEALEARIDELARSGEQHLAAIDSGAVGFASRVEAVEERLSAEVRTVELAVQVLTLRARRALDGAALPAGPVRSSRTAVPAVVVSSAPLRGTRDVVQSSPLFDPAWYGKKYGLPPAGEEPLEHYIREGWRLGYRPSEWFDPADYRRRTGASLLMEPLTDFHAREASFGLPPATPTFGEGSQLDRELRWHYLVSGGYRWPQRVNLYRIVGNDLPPRHPPGQSLALARDILEREPELPRCRSWWILNRIVDRVALDELVRLLERHDQRYLIIPADLQGVAATPWRWTAMDGTGRAAFLGPDRGGRVHQKRVDDLYAPRIRAAIRINSARNEAIEAGIRDGATWILPLDGTCSFSADGWAELIEAIDQHRHRRYLAIPTARMSDVSLLSVPGFRPPAADEHMLAFRRDARERFDESLAYGDKEKVALLHGLGVPGPWREWDWSDHDVRSGSSVDAGQFEVVSWVARLPSGKEELETDRGARAEARRGAVRGLIDRIDVEAVRNDFDRWFPSLFDVSSSRVLIGDPVDDLIGLERVDAIARRALGSAGRASVEPDVPTLLHEAWALGLAAYLERVEPVRALDEAGQVLRAICRLTSIRGGQDEPMATAVVLDLGRLLHEQGALDGEVEDELFAWSRVRLSSASDAGTVPVPEDGDALVAAVGSETGRLAVSGFLGEYDVAVTSLRRLEELLYRQLDHSAAFVLPEPSSTPTTSSGTAWQHRVEVWIGAALVARPFGVELLERPLADRTLRSALSLELQDPRWRTQQDGGVRRHYAFQSVFGRLPPGSPGGTDESTVGSMVGRAELGIRPFWNVLPARPLYRMTTEGADRG